MSVPSIERVETSASPRLSQLEAACLDALRSGADQMMTIASHMERTPGTAAQALRSLSRAGLVCYVHRRWRLTDHGAHAVPSVASRGWHRRDPSAPRKPPRTGTAGDRLLGLLDRPWHGAELVQQLGVSRQRVHQVITALSHAGVIRVAVTNPLSFAIARADDTTILLKPEEERVLSALPDQAATTAQKLAVAAHVDQTVVTRVLSTLHQHGFVHPTQSTGKGVMYELTTAGRGHWQRRASLPRAATPPLPFRSGRVQTVLSCLESVGPIRTRDIAQGLGLPLQLINGLMQYLKRRDMVRPVSDARRAPYVLTEEGQRTLAAMRLEELALAA